jgi:hypothetical protein
VRPATGAARDARHVKSAGNLPKSAAVSAFLSNPGDHLLLVGVFDQQRIV